MEQLEKLRLYVTLHFFAGGRASCSDYTTGTSRFTAFCTDYTPWFPDEAGPSQLSSAPLTTHPAEGTQPTESALQARQRRLPDQLTYPTVQIRHRGEQVVKRGRCAG